MEIASTSSNLRYQFPTDQRYETKHVACKSTSVHIIPKLQRDGKERRDVVMETPKKRKHSNEENPPEKRQKKTPEVLKSKFTEPVEAKAIKVQSFTTRHVTKTAKSKVITTKPREKTEDHQDHSSFKDMIAKAREKVQEKRHIDHRNTDIRSQRIAARLALNQVVKTFDFDDHLKYHMELEKLGCDFISDQVNCLYKFSLLSRADYYIDESL